MEHVKVILIDPHQLSREGLRLLLDGATCDVSATKSLEEAERIAREVRPDILLMVLENAS